MNWLTSWWVKWFGKGTADDWRNPFWRLTEWLRITPRWSVYLLDIRLGFKRSGKWSAYVQWPPWNFRPVTQNFWNGIFTFNVYMVVANLWSIPIPFPFLRYNFVFRPSQDWWIEGGVGFLFDRGEFAIKFPFVPMTWKGEGGYRRTGLDRRERVSA